MTAPGDSRRLTVLAIGGHGLSAASEQTIDRERQRIAALGPALHALAADRHRLLVVHGNGPQVGRLLNQAKGGSGAGINDLDVHTAQTQGELGYLICQALPAPNAALITRVSVGASLGPPVKPIGPVLQTPPDDQPYAETPRGWRVVVPSPKPAAVQEIGVIDRMLETHHLVAGGGGGVPLSNEGNPLNAVIDKDWVASMLAVQLGADLLIFATDVDYVYENFGTGRARPLASLDTGTAEALLASGVLDAGSMAPKVGSALEFVQATSKRACICAVEALSGAVGGTAGTQIG